MPMPAFVGSRLLNKQDKFLEPDSSVGFLDMFYEHQWLHPAAVYRPITMEISYLRGKKASGVLVLERAYPQQFTFQGVSFYLIDSDRRATKMVHTETYRELPADLLNKQAAVATPGGQFWLETGLSLTGPAGVISGQRITLPGPNSRSKILVEAAATGLKHPIFRLRRGADGTATEVVGTGTGILKDFTFTLANTPVCPKSVKISFNDGAAKTDMIRDSGNGDLQSTPTSFLLDTVHGVHSRIDYSTGDGELHFDAAHIPAVGTPISLSYEYPTDGMKDDTEYIVEWSYEEA